MSIELIFIVVVALIVIGFFALVANKKIPKKLKTDKFNDQWKQLQAYCKDRQTWPTALTQADKLLDSALKRRRFKGKTMGERMVSAQRAFTDNDGVWFAHNLYKKVIAEEVKRLKETDVKEALVAYRQALRDLGALEQ